MRQKRFFYESFAEEELGYDESPGTRNPELPPRPTTGACPYCGSELESYLSVYATDGPSIAVGWLEDLIAKTGGSGALRVDDSQITQNFHVLYSCIGCGWWWDERTEFNVTSASLTNSAILRAFDLAADDTPINIIRQHLAKNWGDRKLISAQKAEELVSSVFKEHFDCEVRYITEKAYAPDGGIDFVLVNRADGAKHAVQVKRRIADKAESVMEISNFIGALVRADIANGIYVTTADRFSQRAEEAATLPSLAKRSVFLKLYSGSDLFDLLRLYTEVERTLPEQLEHPHAWMRVATEEKLSELRNEFWEEYSRSRKAPERTSEPMSLPGYSGADSDKACSLDDIFGTECPNRFVASDLRGRPFSKRARRPKGHLSFSRSPAVGPGTVHILGAGFSSCCGFPVLADLLREVDRFMIEDYLRDYEGLYPGNKNGLSFMDDYWKPFREEIVTDMKLKEHVSLHEDGLLDGNIEDLLDLLDNLMEGLQEADENRPIVSRWRFSLAHALAFYFRTTCLSIENTPERAEYIAQYLFQHVQPGDTILSFNYDNLVERLLFSSGALAKDSQLAWRQGDGYGFELPKMYLLAGAESANLLPDVEVVDDEVVAITCEAGSNVQLLYLNGCAFWTWEGDDLGFVISGALMWRKMRLDKGGSIIDLSVPILCGGRKEKEQRFAMLPTIWEAAEEALRTANKIQVVGCGLGQIDHGIGRRIVEAISETTAEVTVIDPLPRQQQGLLARLQDRAAHVQATLEDFLGRNRSEGKREGILPRGPGTKHSRLALEEMECCGCGESFSHEVWVILDPSERPDLWERFGLGELNSAVCP